MSSRFEILLSEKNDEINQLKLLVAEKGKTSTEVAVENIFPIDNSNKEIENLAKKIQENPKLKKANGIISYHILGSYSGLMNADYITTEILSFYQSNRLIEKTGQMFNWTDKGKEVNKILSDQEFK